MYWVNKNVILSVQGRPNIITMRKQKYTVGINDWRFCCRNYMSFLIDGKVVLHVSVMCLDTADSSWTIYKVINYNLVLRINVCES